MYFVKKVPPEKYLIHTSSPVQKLPTVSHFLICTEPVLLLGRKVMTNLVKSRDITLPTKVCLVKAMVFQWSCMDVRVGL